MENGQQDVFVNKNGCLPSRQVVTSEKKIKRKKGKNSRCASV